MSAYDGSVADAQTGVPVSESSQPVLLELLALRHCAEETRLGLGPGCMGRGQLRLAIIYTQ